MEETSNLERCVVSRKDKQIARRYTYGHLDRPNTLIFFDGDSLVVQSTKRNDNVLDRIAVHVSGVRLLIRLFSKLLVFFERVERRIDGRLVRDSRCRATGSRSSSMSVSSLTSRALMRA